MGEVAMVVIHEELHQTHAFEMRARSGHALVGCRTVTRTGFPRYRSHCGPIVSKPNISTARARPALPTRRAFVRNSRQASRASRTLNTDPYSGAHTVISWPSNSSGMPHSFGPIDTTGTPDSIASIRPRV